MPMRRRHPHVVSLDDVRITRHGHEAVLSTPTRRSGRLLHEGAAPRGAVGRVAPRELEWDGVLRGELGDALAHAALRSPRPRAGDRETERETVLEPARSD